MPAQVKVLGEYFVTARPLARGQAITAGDLARRRGDLAELPAGIVTEEAQAIGKSLNVSVQSGQILRSDVLRAPAAVQQGQSVRVVSKGKGFQVATEGKALNNAAAGQVVQVRTASGQTLSGIARADGTRGSKPLTHGFKRGVESCHYGFGLKFCRIVPLGSLEVIQIKEEHREN
ncbi:MAG: flagellar basal body P-ring formation chaperone FlgA [Rhodocyclaceae bacterium]|nr:flagellar basal body P-ring formation chaperone FlgA [Rhodocyclaceae bacterium]